MAQEKLTKDQRREQAREIARVEREKRQRAETRNKILIRGGATVGIVAVLAAVGFGIWAGTRPAGPGPLNMASDGILLVGEDGEITPVETDAIPEGGEPIGTDQSKYDAPAHIVVYVDYGCPFCGQFETGNAAQIEQLVSAGLATLEVHPISILDRVFQGTKYSTRAANAAACVAANEPEFFFDVNAALFANQPAEQTPGLDDNQLLDILAQAGVDTPEVQECVVGQTYADWVTAATDRAKAGPLPNTDGAQVSGTPAIFVNGQPYTPTTSLANAQEFAAFIASVADFGTEEETE